MCQQSIHCPLPFEYESPQSPTEKTKTSALRFCSLDRSPPCHWEAWGLRVVLPKRRRPQISAFLAYTHAQSPTHRGEPLTLNIRSQRVLSSNDKLMTRSEGKPVTCVRIHPCVQLKMLFFIVWRVFNRSAGPVQEIAAATLISTLTERFAGAHSEC